MADIVHTTVTQACGARIPGCACDLVSNDICDLLDIPRGSINEFCECHDCYVCGEINCDGHPS